MKQDKPRKLTGRKLNCYLTLKYFLDHNINEGWIPNYVFIDVEIGAVSGLRSLRKLKTEFGIKFEEPRQVIKLGQKTGTWEYKIISNPTNITWNSGEGIAFIEILYRKFADKFGEKL